MDKGSIQFPLSVTARWQLVLIRINMDSFILCKKYSIVSFRILERKTINLRTKRPIHRSPPSQVHSIQGQLENVIALLSLSVSSCINNLVFRTCDSPISHREFKTDVFDIFCCMLLDHIRQTFMPRLYTFITWPFHHCSSNRFYFFRSGPHIPPRDE